MQILHVSTGSGWVSTIGLTRSCSFQPDSLGILIRKLFTEQLLFDKSCDIYCLLENEYGPHLLWWYSYIIHRYTLQPSTRSTLQVWLFCSYSYFRCKHFPNSYMRHQVKNIVGELMIVPTEHHSEASTVQKMSYWTKKSDSPLSRKWKPNSKGWLS